MFGVFWCVLVCFGVFWGVLGCFGVFWGVLRCLGVWGIGCSSVQVFTCHDISEDQKGDQGGGPKNG